jgi:hypothetical protein
VIVFRDLARRINSTMKFNRATLIDAGPSQGNGAAPPNNGMELTGQSVTVLARERARPAPLRPAAHPRR